jgi:hypothetical protein
MLLPPLVPTVLELPPVAPPEEAPDGVPELPAVVPVADPEFEVLQADMHKARQMIVGRRVMGLLHTTQRQLRFRSSVAQRRLWGSRRWSTSTVASPH